MICEYCEEHTTKKTVKKLHWFKGKLFIFDNVEAEVCAECGERYFHAKILDDLDRILESKHKVEKRVEVEVINMFAQKMHLEHSK